MAEICNSTIWLQLCWHALYCFGQIGELLIYNLSLVHPNNMQLAYTTSVNMAVHVKCPNPVVLGYIHFVNCKCDNIKSVLII